MNTQQWHIAAQHISTKVENLRSLQSLNLFWLSHLPYHQRLASNYLFKIHCARKRCYETFGIHPVTTVVVEIFVGNENMCKVNVVLFTIGFQIEDTCCSSSDRMYLCLRATFGVRSHRLAGSH